MAWRRKNTKQAEKKDLVKQASLIPSEHLNVIRELGEGHYAVVHLGEWKQHPGDQKPMHVAIKSMKNADIDGVLKSILQEAQTMQKLCHDYIVKLFGISLPSGDESLRLITEYAPSGSLEENLQKKNKNVMLVSTLCKFASQVAQGMHYLASQQLVHRDLASRNILLFNQDLVKICDFGLARSLDTDGAKAITLNTLLPVAWMPPEAIEKSVFTPASDVWSYGVTLWEMFTFGQKPWDGFSLLQIKQMVTNDTGKRLEKPHVCPDGFYELIMLKCWASDPRERPTFEYIVNSIMPQLQPKEGTAKACHKTTVQGHLSCANREKLTIISRGDGMLLAQNENGSIGFIGEKYVDFPRKSGVPQPILISRPYEVKKRDSKEVLAELQKMAGEEMVFNLSKNEEKNTGNTGNGILEMEEDDVALNPNYTMYPDPYPAMTNWAAAGPTEPGAVGPEPFDYTAMGAPVGSDEEDYTSMDHEYCSLKVVQQQENLQPGLPHPLLPRPGRTVSESEILTPDRDHGRPFQIARLSRDDSAVQLGREGTSGGKMYPPDIPGRPYLIKDGSAALPGEGTNVISERDVASNPYATAPRKRPIPTPRRKTLSTSESTETTREAPNEVCAAGQRGGPPKPPPPYKSARMMSNSGFGKGDSDVAVNSTRDSSEKRAEVTKPGGKQQMRDEGSDQRSPADFMATITRDTASALTLGQISGASAGQSVTSQGVCNQGKSSESQIPAPLVEVTEEVYKQPGRRPRYENNVVVADLIDLSPDTDVGPLLPPKKRAPPVEQPLYLTPLSLPMYPDIPPEVINQPPPRREDLFGGTWAKPNLQPKAASTFPCNTVPLFDRDGGLGTSHQPSVGALGFSALNIVTNNKQASNGVNPVFKPVDPAVGAPNPGGTDTNQGSYGEEIDAGIRKIQEVCGMDVARDWCYAALLQYQGGVEEVVRVIKVQKLADITGKTEDFCKRTLTHCNWDMDRAAGYIMEEFEDKDV